MKRPAGLINAEWLALLRKSIERGEMEAGEGITHAYEAGFLSGYACHNPFRPSPEWFSRVLRASKKSEGDL